MAYITKKQFDELSREGKKQGFSDYDIANTLIQKGHSIEGYSGNQNIQLQGGKILDFIGGKEIAKGIVGTHMIKEFSKLSEKGTESYNKAVKKMMDKIKTISDPVKKKEEEQRLLTFMKGHTDPAGEYALAVSKELPTSRQIIGSAAQMVGTIGGSGTLGTGMKTGQFALKAPKAMSTLTRVGVPIAQQGVAGGLTSAGRAMEQNKTIGQTIGQAGLGFGIGAGTQALSQLASYGLKKLTNQVPKTVYSGMGLQGRKESVKGIIGHATEGTETLAEKQLNKGFYKFTETGIKQLDDIEKASEVKIQALARSAAGKQIVDTFDIASSLDDVINTYKNVPGNTKVVSNLVKIQDEILSKGNVTIDELLKWKRNIDTILPSSTYTAAANDVVTTARNESMLATISAIRNKIVDKAPEITKLLDDQSFAISSKLSIANMLASRATQATNPFTAVMQNVGRSTIGHPTVVPYSALKLYQTGQGVGKVLGNVPWSSPSKFKNIVSGVGSNVTPYMSAAYRTLLTKESTKLTR